LADAAVRERVTGGGLKWTQPRLGLSHEIKLNYRW